MSRFNEITHDEVKHELTVGAGCVFDEIYKFIRAKGYNIVGGGGSVGLGGWMVGGGYSLKTNQYGLGIDNLVRVRIVTPPKGHEVLLPVEAAKDTNSDLFWAIKVCLRLNL
jgi:FAD/FMN-containing dehydrogenase